MSQNNLMMDGISAMDTGNNGTMLAMNIESIGEIKILTQGYQAEFGVSSGLQVTAVTKSGTNRFRRSSMTSSGNPLELNSWVNQANGDAKPISDEKDWGYSLGDPIGKPGGNNKLFFYSHEYRPRNLPINNGNPIRLPCRLRPSAVAISRRASTTTARSFRSCGARSIGGRIQIT